MLPHHPGQSARAGWLAGWLALALARAAISLLPFSLSAARAHMAIASQPTAARNACGPEMLIVCVYVYSVLRIRSIHIHIAICTRESERYPVRSRASTDRQTAALNIYGRAAPPRFETSLERADQGRRKHKRNTEEGTVQTGLVPHPPLPSPMRHGRGGPIIIAAVHAMKGPTVLAGRRRNLCTGFASVSGTGPLGYRVNNRVRACCHRAKVEGGRRKPVAPSPDGRGPACQGHSQTGPGTARPGPRPERRPASSRSTASDLTGVRERQAAAPTLHAHTRLHGHRGARAPHLVPAAQRDYLSTQLFFPPRALCGV